MYSLINNPNQLSQDLSKLENEIGNIDINAIFSDARSDMSNDEYDNLIFDILEVDTNEKINYKIEKISYALINLIEENKALHEKIHSLEYEKNQLQTSLFNFRNMYIGLENMYSNFKSNYEHIQKNYLIVKR